MEIITEVIKEETEIVRQKEIKKGNKYLGKVLLKPGMQLWELNTKTAIIKPIEIEETVVDLKGNIRKKYVTKEDCLYVPAINKRNAEKKFLRYL